MKEVLRQTAEFEDLATEILSKELDECDAASVRELEEVSGICFFIFFLVVFLVVLFYAEFWIKIKIVISDQSSKKLREYMTY